MLERCVSRHGDRDQPGPWKPSVLSTSTATRSRPPPIFSGQVAPLGVARLQHLRRARSANVDLEEERQVGGRWSIWSKPRNNDASPSISGTTRAAT